MARTGFCSAKVQYADVPVPAEEGLLGKVLVPKVKNTFIDGFESDENEEFDWGPPMITSKSCPARATLSTCDDLDQCRDVDACEMAGCMAAGAPDALGFDEQPALCFPETPSSAVARQVLCFHHLCFGSQGLLESCQMLETCQIRVKNTFLELGDNIQTTPLRRTRSDSDLSTNCSGSSQNTPRGLSPGATTPRLLSRSSESGCEHGAPNDGALPSVGSMRHAGGTCQPCSFHRRGKCNAGSECLYCHFSHDKLKRPGKRTRVRVRARTNALGTDAAVSADGLGGKGFGSIGAAIGTVHKPELL